jgi:DNA-binding response OmpR family regulator
MSGADNPKEPFDSNGGPVKKRILIIDDDNEVRSLLSRTLSQAGFEVFTVANGDEGTRLCRQQSMDLVIVDMIMPEKDGLETLMEIRRGSPKARIIAMSGAPRTSVMDPLSVALKLGAVASLAKPFTPGEFLNYITQHLPGASTEFSAAA